MGRTDQKQKEPEDGDGGPLVPASELTLTRFGFKRHFAASQFAVVRIADTHRNDLPNAAGESGLATV